MTMVCGEESGRVHCAVLQRASECVAQPPSNRKNIPVKHSRIDSSKIVIKQGEPAVFWSVGAGPDGGPPS